MNGPHDLGGQMGFGPVAPELNEPQYHAPWEARAMGLTLACGALGHWPLDEGRFARESLHPAVYYKATYYEIWIRALESLLVKYGLVSADELAKGMADPAPPHPRQLSPGRVPVVLAKGTPTDRALSSAPRFVPGDRVRTINAHPHHHTRLPRYLRGRSGVIESEHGGFVLPDTNAHGQGENPGRLYTVIFDGTEIWGPDSEPGLTISADLWEGYLEHA